MLPGGDGDPPTPATAEVMTGGAVEEEEASPAVPDGSDKRGAAAPCKKTTKYAREMMGNRHRYFVWCCGEASKDPTHMQLRSRLHK